MLVKQGSDVFSGEGNCFACHGPSGIGTALAPELTTGHQWIHIGGTYREIASLVKTGMPKPKESPAPMPPMGGA